MAPFCIRRATGAHSRWLGLATAILGLAPIPRPAAGAPPDEAAPPADRASTVEEMVVVGEARPDADVLAGATTTRVETDDRLLEGARLDDLLTEVPGVQIRRFGGAGERFEISIRGSRPEQVPVFLDGVRLDTSLTGRSDLSTICVDALEEVQVTRGAGAARAGTGAIGGVVNLVSRRAPAKPETRLRIGGGNFGTVEGSVRHARRQGPWSLSLAYCGFHTDGDFDYQRSRVVSGGVPIGTPSIETRENNESDRHTFLGRVGRRLGRAELRITQLTSHLERGTPGLETDLRTRADERNLSLLTSVGLEHPVAKLPDGRFELLFAHRFEGNDFEDPEPRSSASEPIDAETRVHNWTGRSRLDARFSALAGDHEVSWVAEGRFDQRGSNEARSESRAAVALRVESTSSWWQDRLALSPSLRFERIGGLDGEWIPGLFLEARPLDWVRIKSSASRSYRAPSFQELYLPDKGFIRGNEDLDPEEAWNFEVGLVLRSPFEAAWLDGEIEATWFAGEIEDSIVFKLVSNDLVAPVNTGRAKSRGYELAFRWRPHPWLRLSGSRTVTQAKDDETNRNLPGIAVSQIDGRLELGPRDRLKIVGEVHYTGRIPLDDAGISEIRSRVSFDASAAVDLTKLPVPGADRVAREIWLSVRGRNLSNVALRDAQFFPQPGRNFSVALEGSF